ncbi:MAG: hypothetical protein RR277_01735, partial [Rikenellaceae bacterium]
MYNIEYLSIRMNIFFKIIIIICSFFYSSKSIANIATIDEGRYVLILNTYNETNEWSNDIQKYITQTFYGTANKNIRLEELSSMMIKTREDFEAKKEHLLKRYEQIPQAVVIIGDAGWIFYREVFGNKWKDVPVVICSVWNYTTTLDNYLAILSTGKPLDNASVIPYEESLRNYNATSVRQPIYIKETIDLMKQLIPKMKKVVFISDTRYLSSQSRYTFDKIMDENFHDLSSVHLQYGKMSTEQLLDTLKNFKDDVGILFHSWYTIEGSNGSTYTSNKTHRIIGSFTSAPLFTITDGGVTDGVFAGGYFSLTDEYAATIIQILDSVIEGKRADKIPFIGINDPKTYLNYTNLSKYNISDSLYPPDAILYQKPENIYLILLWGGLIGICFLLLILQIVLLLRKRNKKEKEFTALSKYKELFSNMPVAYATQQLVYDATGNVVDTIILDINPRFEREFNVE